MNERRRDRTAQYTESAPGAGRAAPRADRYTFVMSNVPLDAELPGPAVAILLDNHRAFLRYLEGRVGDRALAEDILQDAFIRNLEKAEQVPEEALVPWFYRTLRNAAIDQYRRRTVKDRALESFARELETRETPPPELEAEICACVARLAATLKPEYADALRAIEVDGVPVKAYADANGLTSTNAGVRVFRARQALRKRVAQSCGTCAEHGCVNCTCGAANPEQTAGGPHG